MKIDEIILEKIKVSINIEILDCIFLRERKTFWKPGFIGKLDTIFSPVTMAIAMLPWKP